MSDNFKPDSSIKKFLKEISSAELIKIINGILGTNYSLSSKVFFENTEHFTIVGDLDRSSRKGDLTIKLNSDEIQSDVDIQNETTNNIILEIQSTKDRIMGFRMFVYALNASNLQKNKDDKNVYIFPKGATIYAVENMKEKNGFDKVSMQIEKFKVGENEYFARNGDLLTVEFPFINILAMDFDEFENSDLELLKVIYPYKYKQKPELLLNVESYENIIQIIIEYFKKCKGNDKIIVGELITNLFADIYEIAKTDIEKYGKAVEIMEVAEKTYAEILIEESMFEGERKKGLETAIEMLNDNLPVTSISKYTKLSIEEIKDIQKGLL